MRIVLLVLVVKVFLSCQVSHVKSFISAEQDLVVNNCFIMIDSNRQVCEHRTKEAPLIEPEEKTKLGELTDEANVSITNQEYKTAVFIGYQMSAYNWNESLRSQQSRFTETNLIEQSMLDFYKTFLSGAIRFICHFPRTDSLIIKVLLLIIIRILLKGTCQSELHFLSFAFLNLDLSFATISPSPSFSVTSWQTATTSSHVGSHLNATHAAELITSSSVLRNTQESSSVKPEGLTQSSESPTKSYPRGDCDLGWVKFDNYCYLPSNERMSFDHAQRACSYHGANMISITSKSENELIFNISKDFFGFPKNNFLWLGMERRESTSKLHWIDNNDLIYENWILGEPDGNGACVQMIMKGLWEDATCFEKNSIICKKRSSYPPTYSRSTELIILISIPFTFAFIMLFFVSLLIFKSIKDADDTFYGYGKNRNKEKMHAAIVNVTASIAHVSAEAPSPERRQSEASPRKTSAVSSRSQSLSSSRVNPAVDVSDTGSQSSIPPRVNPRVEISDADLKSQVSHDKPTAEVPNVLPFRVQNRKNSISRHVKVENRGTADLEEIEMQVCASAISLDKEPARFQSTTSLDYLVSKSYIKPKSRKLRGLKKPEATIQPSGKAGIYRKKTSV